MKNVDQGLLVGRAPIGKASYEYVIIPPHDNVDTYITTPPSSILSKDVYVVNEKRVTKLLKYLYFTEFTWRLQFTQQGQIYRAFVKTYRPIPVDGTLDALKEIDPSSEFYKFEKSPIIDEDFLISIARSTGAGVGLPKRFYSITIATRVIEGDKTVPIIVNFAEAFLWLQENPGKLLGTIILPTYKYAILLADSVEKDELVQDILDRVNLSVQAFRNMYFRAVMPAGEEEE